MKAIALIPARYGSTRFPGKMLQPIKGIALITRTYQSVVNTGLFDEVYVVTDSDKIQAEIEAHNGKVLRSKKEHDSGTDRIAEAAEQIEGDVIVNIQGDEPFIQKEPLAKVLALFEGVEGAKVQAASLVQETKDEEIINNPNRVKVLLKENGEAIYFSRSAVPYLRDKNIDQTYYLHIGIYAFRKDALIKFAGWQPSPHERVEQLECNRFIDYGMPIKMAVTQHVGVAVDAPEDVAKAEAYMQQNGIV